MPIPWPVIPVPFPEREIFRRLGRNFHRAEMTESQTRQFAYWMHEGAALCCLRGVSETVGITQWQPDAVVLVNGMTIPGRQPAALLRDCEAVFFFAATAGGEIVAERDAALARGEGGRALVLDACGSEIADAAMDFLQERQNQSLRRWGKCLTERRFSPGYGDLPLSFQREMVRLLHLEEWGLHLSDSCILTPEKSVTALAGVRQNL